MRLSSDQGKSGRRAHPRISEKLLGIKEEEEEEEVPLPFFDQKPVQFGICYHQVPANKYYYILCS